MYGEQISDDELKRRWHALRVLMASEELDCIVTQGSNDWLGGHIRWITGTSAYYGYPRSVVLFADTQQDMLVVEHGAQGGSRMPDTGDIAYRGVGRVLYSASYVSAAFTWAYDAAVLIEALENAGIRRLGLLGGGGGYHGFVNTLMQWANRNGIEVVDVTDAVDRMKAVKSDEEQAFIRRTAAIQDEVMDEIARILRPGLRDFEVAAHARRVAQDLGAEQGVYLCASAPPGTPAVYRQKYAQSRRIESGDTFLILVETNGPAGFYTEIARTFVLGKASSTLRDATGMAIAAQKHTLGLLKPGTPCADILRTFNRYMCDLGLPEEERLFCHGQGYDLVERPLIREDEPAVIETGMSIVVHPSFLVNDIFAQVCDNYLIGDEGPGVCLHRTPKQVIEI